MDGKRFRILIADDEQLTRIGIRYFISMMQNYEVIDEAVNGREALEKIYKLNPDIIILDIRMPIKSGLEVLEDINNSNHPAKVIILSGFNDFLYAQKGIKYGACDYLLKPTSYDNLFETLERVKKIINEEKMIKNKLEDIRRISSLNLKYFLSQFYVQLIKENINFDEYKEKLNTLGIEHDEVIVMILGLDKYYHLKYNYPEEIFNQNVNRINNHINEYLESLEMKYSRSFICENTFTVVLFTNEFKEEDIKKIVIKLREYLNNNSGYTFSISVGIKVTLNQLAKSYENAKKKLDQRFFLGDNRVFYELENFCNGDKINCKEYISNILEAIKQQNINSIKNITDDYFRILKKLKIAKEEWLRFCYEITLSVSELIENYSIHGNNINIIQKINIISNLSSQNDVKDWLLTFLNDAVKCFQGEISLKPLIIRKAIKYLEDHYKGQLSLLDLSKHVSLSTNYFCSLFKKYTGKTVLEYLTYRKILEAKRLLRSTRKTVSEIAYELGYTNPRYFSEVFLRHEGITPTNYRKTL